MEKAIIKIGFWDDKSGTKEGEAEVASAQGQMSEKETKIVLAYIESSTDHVAYKGLANCRACGKHLGSRDMLTPDQEFIFPDQYEHYIEEHGVAPPDEFIIAAVKWKENQ